LGVFGGEGSRKGGSGETQGTWEGALRGDIVGTGINREPRVRKEEARRAARKRGGAVAVVVGTEVC